MKKKTVILLAVLILAAVCLFNSVYTVEENEYGCTVRLSKIISTMSRACTLKCRFWTA